MFTARRLRVDDDDWWRQNDLRDYAASVGQRLFQGKAGAHLGLFNRDGSDTWLRSEQASPFGWFS